MWLPSSLDLVVYSGLVLVALYPFAQPLLGRIRWPHAPARPDDWQSASVATLLALQSDLEARKMPAAVKLCRELTWEILGGDGST
jgi:hypothetical protein